MERLGGAPVLTIDPLGSFYLARYGDSGDYAIELCPLRAGWRALAKVRECTKGGTT
jgi:hypothetical protein